MTPSVHNIKKWELGAHLKSGVSAFHVTTKMNRADSLNPKLTRFFSSYHYPDTLVPLSPEFPKVMSEAFQNVMDSSSLMLSE